MTRAHLMSILRTTPLLAELRKSDSKLSTMLAHGACKSRSACFVVLPGRCAPGNPLEQVAVNAAIRLGERCRVGIEPCLAVQSVALF